MDKQDSWSGITLFILFVLPISLYFLFRNNTTPQYRSVPYAYTIDKNGDSLYHRLPNFSFTDQEGQVFNRDRMLGNIYILSFMSLEDTLKTKILNANLKRIYDNIEEGANIRLLSIHTDSTSLATLASELAIEADKWAFVHGSRTEVFKLGAEAFRMPEFVGKPLDTTPFTPQSIALIDKEGRVRKYYPGTDLGQVRIITDDLRSLIVMEYPDELQR